MILPPTIPTPFPNPPLSQSRNPYTAENPPPNSRSWNPRYRRLRSHHPARRLHAYSRAVASPRCGARHEEPPHVPHRREDFQGLDRRGGIGALLAQHGEIADEWAIPPPDF